MQLSVEQTPSVLPKDAPSDFSFALTLTNDGDESVDVYPLAAQLSPVSGWLSPVWRLEVTSRANGLVHLRTWYGPPGHPPGAAYFNEARTMLAPGESITERLTGAWIPANRLRDRQLSRQTVDPKGMDGVPESFESGAFYLVFGRTTNDVLDGEVETLRGSVVAWFGETTATLEMTYAQQPWLAFAPRTAFESNTVSVALTA